MRRIYYLVGRDGYYTRCNTLSSAEKQKAQDKGYEIKTMLEDVEEQKPALSPIRKAMLEQFGYVSAKLKDKVVLN